MWTVDLGRLDEHGRHYVLGRLKRIVVRGGLNISPAEVEHAPGTHPQWPTRSASRCPARAWANGCAPASSRPPACPPPCCPISPPTHLLAHGLARHKLPEQLLVENGTWAPPARSAAALRPPAQFAA